MSTLVSELVALGRCIQAGKQPKGEIERLYISPAARALVLSALWAMAETDRIIAIQRTHAFGDECVALEDASAASRLAHAATALEEVG